MDGGHGQLPSDAAALRSLHTAVSTPAIVAREGGLPELARSVPRDPAMPGIPPNPLQPCSAQSCPPSPLRALDKGRGVALPLGAPSSNALPALLSWGPRPETALLGVN